MIVFIARSGPRSDRTPGTPAGLGYVEASIALALTMIGVNQSVALSIGHSGTARLALVAWWSVASSSYFLGARRAL